jgi:hypothetical protein
MTTESARKMTEIIIVSLVVALVVYDVIVEMKFGVNATISQVIFDTASHNPWIALAAGILVGHWFWR